MYKFNDRLFAPSMVSSKGELIAAMCRPAAGKSWGYIEIVCSTSTDGGKSWSEPTAVAVPPARAISSDKENTKSAFFTNPVMAVAPNGDIVMLVTFFPESKGTADMKYLEKNKTAFTMFDGKPCPIIYDKDSSYYIVLENGNVIDKTKAKTAFTVKGIGELYRGDEYMGNVYLNGAQGKSDGKGKTTFGSTLKTPKRSYVYMLKSTDNGKTWSEPRDVTAGILFEDDGAFAGTSSGAGITTKSGRIIMPLFTNKNSFAVYSDDNGKSWSRNPRSPYLTCKGMWTAFEAPNGIIHALGDGKTSLSADNGIIWTKGDKSPVNFDKPAKCAAVCCETLYVSHKNKKNSGGQLSSARFLLDKRGEFKAVKWVKDNTDISDEAFGASCLAQIDETTLGILYESGETLKFNIIKIED